MSNEDLAGVTFDESADGLQVVIPARRRNLALIFDTLVFLFMPVFEYIIIRLILAGDSNIVHWIGLICGAIFIALLARRVSWFLTGELVIIAGARNLTLSEKSFGFKRSWDYRNEQIQSLRVLPYVVPSDDTKSFLSEYTGRRGRIAFNYGTQIITFGDDVDEAVALKVQKRLKPHIPA